MTRKDASRLGLAALVSAGLALGLFLLAGGSSTAPRPTIPSVSKGAQFKAGPMAFEPTARGGFITRGAGYALAIDSRGPTMAVGRSAVTLAVDGARTVAPVPSRRQKLVVNRYIGHTARTGIPTFGRVVYPGVLPGVNLQYHGRDGQLEYDFALRAKADPSAIAMHVDGARSLRLSPNGDLLITTKDGTLRQHKPVAFQAGRRVAVGFVLKGKRFGFRLGRHDPSKPLLIDPHLALTDYIGGTGLDSAQKIAVDSTGNIYIVGYTNSTSIQGGSGSTSGDSDAFVARLAPDGTRQWITYLGGSAKDQGMDIALDGSDRPYVVGSTKSTNFPTTAGVAQTSLVGGEDGFVTALTPSGTLRYSTYNGSADLDISNGLAVTPSGIVYSAVASGTTENNGVLVESTGYVIVLDASGAVAHALHFYTASNDDTVSAVTPVPGCDSTNCAVYLAGYTYDGTALRFFPYVLKWDFATASSPWGGFFTYQDLDNRGNPVDADYRVAAIALDPNGNPTITGTVFLKSNPYYAFVASFRASDGATESQGFTYDPAATGGNSQGTDIAYDAQGNLYSLAWTSAGNGVKTDAVQANNGGGYDGILLKYAPGPFTTPGPNQGHFVWQSFVGGPGADFGYGVATDTHGGSYVVGQTDTGGWLTSPVTQSKSTGADGFIWKIQTNAPTITDGPTGTIGSRDVTFKYTTGETDGAIECALSGPTASAFTSCGTGPSGSHDFKGLADGDYTFQVRDSDSGGTTSGVVTSQAFKVDTTPHASFTIAPNPSLVGRAVTFDGSGSTAASAIKKYEWDLDGNGTFETDTGTTATASQVYPVPGTVNVTLRVTDSDGKTSTQTNELHVTTANDIGTNFGVTINNGAQFTNDPHVTVTSTFPVFTTSLLFSNDGGFGKAQTFPAKKDTPWLLDSSGPERLPKTIYVRFLTGVVSGETHQDDIILDETPPKVDQAVVLPSAPAGSGATAARLRKYKVKFKAHDSNSGVSLAQITANKKKPGKALKYKTKLVVKSAKKPKWARARDRAGNWSKWKKMR